MVDYVQEGAFRTGPNSYRAGDKQSGPSYREKGGEDFSGLNRSHTMLPVRQGRFENLKWRSG